ncbi:Glycosyltransferase involved in cell wall bisynthesis [Sphingobacterium nematocida]|uniref:Glycosyltransferase involved in cell wall bisynthesis n=1 Tax=Sphingobacterium nematocida TaxID=1513896 RepID=A0A1T5C8E4_9SPHI|nr:glycosyltransferase family 4 protein [Sphingobacterium nematocida]SKB55704.1 Glycosyltransferase involved in cell wall bisynthesis [Sphingobacterium nematocida]
MQQRSDIEVLFISHKSPPATGGMEKQSYELINGTALYLKIHTLVYDHKEPLWLFFFKLNARIIKLLKVNPEIQVLHFNDGLIASFATFHKGYEHVKKTATLHGLDVVYPLSYFQKKIIPRFNNFDAIFAVSEATAQAALDRGIKAEIIQTIPNGVDPSPTIDQDDAQRIYQRHPGLQQEKKYFITLGRPVKRKGFSWLIQHVIPRLEGDFQLVMLGPYSQKKTIKDRTLSLLPKKLRTLLMLFLGHPSDQEVLQKLLPEQSPKVVHLGKVSNDDLQTLIKSAIAFLMPNIAVPGDMEGFGLVCLEASMAGSLVIASDIDGISSAIKHHKNGLLIPSKDEAAWTSILQNIINDSESFHKHIGAYTEYTRLNYGWDKMARDYSSAFIEICRKM